MNILTSWKSTWRRSFPRWVQLRRGIINRYMTLSFIRYQILSNIFLTNWKYWYIFPAYLPLDLLYPRKVWECSLPVRSPDTFPSSGDEDVSPLHARASHQQGAPGCKSHVQYLWKLCFGAFKRFSGIAFCSAEQQNNLSLVPMGLTNRAQGGRCLYHTGIFVWLSGVGRPGALVCFPLRDFAKSRSTSSPC